MTQQDTQPPAETLARAPLPCPFCGEKAHIEDGRNDRPWVIQCVNSECPAQPFMDHADTRREAVTAWNTRAALTRRAGGDAIPAGVSAVMGRILGHYGEDPGTLARIKGMVAQYREAPFRSAEWLAGEIMRILDSEPANDTTPKPPAGGDAEEASVQIAYDAYNQGYRDGCEDSGANADMEVARDGWHDLLHDCEALKERDIKGEVGAGGDAGAVRQALSQAVGALQPFADADEGDAEDADHMAVWPTFTVGNLRRAVDAVKEGTAALALPAPVVEGERWRHVKRGTVYEVIGYAELQNGNAKGLREGAELAVYRGEDGKLWARERGEFHDGRFAALSEGRSHG